MFRGLELYCADHAHHLVTPGQDLVYLDRDLYDLRKRLSYDDWPWMAETTCWDTVNHRGDRYDRIDPALVF